MKLQKGAHKTQVRGTLLAFAVVLVAQPSLTWGGSKNITDENICDAVDDCIFFDKATPFDGIDVACNEGIVTLTGTADNILAKQRATRLAETVKGVRSVVNRMTVRPSKGRSSTDIMRDVERALQTDPATDSYELTVLVTADGHVTLTGRADSWQEKKLAEKVAAGVNGVTKITNNVMVDYKLTRPDHEIKPEIEKVLEWDVLVDQELIDVSVKDGKVKLVGTVGSAAEKRRAHYDAWIAGVREVDDAELKVRDWARDKDQRTTARVVKSEKEIRDAVNDANLYDPRVKSFNVNPKVSGTEVTLTGKVDNLKAKHAAAANARNTVGVSRIVNRLKVRPRSELADEKVEQAVRNALLRDPYVDRFEITVNVVDGTAYLSGVVDSYFEKAQAEDAASRVNGVVDVSNALAVTKTNWPVIYDPYVYDWHIYDYGWYDYAPSYIAKTDREIKEDIEEELWWSPFVDANEVTVDVDNGEATLTGTVDSWSECRAAAENALEGGAIAVDNNLIVQ
jgi:osmotically-inducible protein OsmY